MLRRSTILKKESVDTLAIGSFDGIHVGHRQLLNHLGENGALFVVDKDQANLTPGIKRSEYAGYPCMFFHFLKNPCFLYLSLSFSLLLLNIAMIIF